MAVTVSLLAVACGGGGGDGGDASPAPATGRFGQVHSGVCAAAAASAEGDRAAAQQAFDDVHTGLHDLAAAVEGKDRTVAARLLEAKQRAEADGGTDDIDDLATAVAEAIEVTGGSAPDACP